MLCSVFSSVLHGVEAMIINVEADISTGLPSFDMVGCLGSGVREAKERVRTAIRNSGYVIPPSRITINISPADVRKEGGGYDLSIAVALLGAIGIVPKESLKDTLFLGELSLNGEIRPVKGVLPVTVKAQESGIIKCFVPKQNANEGAVVEEVRVIGVDSLKMLVEVLNNPLLEEPELINTDRLFEDGIRDYFGNGDFSDIIGQAGVKRAAEIAATGMHNLLIIGPPGSGKTMVSRRIPTILPKLTLSESLEITSIYSAVGESIDGLITQRPFRAPHHTTSPTAMSGGGINPKPGEISLAHKGVLFLDEFAEFKPVTIETLRQPLEDRTILISRVNGNYVFPADIMLVAAMNPCRCGYYPDRVKCHCTPNEIERYYNRISGPIMDRIDICVEAPKIEVTDLRHNSSEEETSEDIRKRVEKAVAIQKQRYTNTSYSFNSQISSKDIKKYCKMEKETEEFLDNIFEKLNLSARAYYKIIRVARTIADLDESEIIKTEHISEAACYRPVENNKIR